MDSTTARNIIDRQLKPPAHTVAVVGSGLVALDVVVSDQEPQQPRFYTGGSCGNVMAILSYLGWQAIPVARFENDEASQRICQDLKRWGAGLDFLHVQPGRAAPMVVHRISHNMEGESFHRFSWNCPCCGSWLPGYQPLPAAFTPMLLNRIESPQVFFMDRVCRGNLILASEYRKRGALIVFEPTGITDPPLFLEALSLAHLLKYSHERMRKVREIHAATTPLLEIETLGQEGLRFRSRISSCPEPEWHKLESYPVPSVKDAAGSGDWCTAALIHALGQGGAASFAKLAREKLQEAFCWAQALAAWNCGFEGARGGMYAGSKEEMAGHLTQIMAERDVRFVRHEEHSSELLSVFKELCPHCQGKAGPPQS